MKLTATKNLFVLIITIFILSACQTSPTIGNSDFLWNVISQQCVPNQITNGHPDPCAEVSFVNNNKMGFAIYKDRNGPLQYLLLPTTKVTGIESPEVLRVDSPNYFFLAWIARSHMEKIYHSSIPEDEISLAVNSQIGRSQNQLHIHISCVRSDVKELIQRNLMSIGPAWDLFPGGILGHHYYARHLTAEEFKNQNSFQLLSNDLPDAKANMKEFGLGLVAIKGDNGALNYILLADRTELATMDPGHVEEIQDHRCPQLYQ